MSDFDLKSDSNMYHVVKIELSFLQKIVSSIEALEVEIKKLNDSMNSVLLILAGKTGKK